MKMTTYRYNLNADPANVHKVQLPSNLGDANADTVRVDDHGDVEEQKVETTALGTSAVLQALYSVEGLQRRPTPSVDLLACDRQSPRYPRIDACSRKLRNHDKSSRNDREQVNLRKEDTEEVNADDRAVSQIWIGGC